MLTTVAASLILAAITGLTFLAYKHPHAYKRIYFFFLLPLTGLVTTFMFGFDFGSMSSTDYVLPFVELSKRTEALLASQSRRLMTPLNGLIVIVLFAYFGFLLTLPFILEEKKENKPEEPSSGKDEEKV